MVLGFRKQDCWKVNPDDTAVMVEEEDFVPVVSFEQLEEYCAKNKYGFNPPRINVEELLKWAKNEVVKDDAV